MICPDLQIFVSKLDHSEICTLNVPAESIIRAEEENTACKVLTLILLSQSPDKTLLMYVYHGMGK
jgi:hypothetical protein